MSSRDIKAWVLEKAASNPYYDNEHPSISLEDVYEVLDRYIYRQKDQYAKGFKDGEYEGIRNTLEDVKIILGRC